MNAILDWRIAICALICIGGFVDLSRGGTDMIVDFQRDNLTLNGKWSSLAHHAGEQVWKSEVLDKLTGWKEISIPGVLIERVTRGASRDAHRTAREAHSALKCVWVTRTFALDERQGGRDAVLKWGGARFGAAAWVNGTQVAGHPTVGPHMVLIPRGVLHPGTNRIVLKVTGWAGVPKSTQGKPPHKPLMPTGASVTPWGSRNPAIYDDIYLEFYDRAYLKWILAIPDPKGGKVTFRVWLDAAGELPASLTISARVTPAAKGGTTVGRAKLTFSKFDKPVDIPVAIKNPMLWTPQTPHMYFADLEGRSGGEPCDEVRFRFGMRDIRVEGGRYRLNGKPLWLRGSNLVNEWLWGEPFASQPKRYLVDEARMMNFNSFRTHTVPPPTSWTNIADEHGIMILAELPVLQNYMDFPLTPAEYDVWREHVLIDAPGWITKLWNHPSIVMWVLSNETVDNTWEAGPYRDMVVALDPTRPTMRTGDMGKGAHGTKENLDMHPCANIAKGPEGWLIEKINNAAANKDPNRTLTCTEYMNIFGKVERMRMLWTGSEEDEANAMRMWADAAAEHTEAMRRVQLDGILPYMFAWFSGIRGANWRKEFPTMMAGAFHSSMAPVTVSLDLFDRNLAPGREMTTPLYLINELPGDIAAQLDVYITAEHTQLIPDGDALKGAIWHRRFERSFKGDTITVEPLRWKVPETPGIYYLVVVLTRRGARPVVSQRMIRPVIPPDPTAVLKNRSMVVLGGDEAIEKWLKNSGVRCAGNLGKGTIRADAVIVCDAAKLGPEALSAAPVILEYVRSGGKLVILNQPEWTWKALVNFEIDRWRNWLNGISSRVFPYEGVDHPILHGVDSELLKRWNGVPGTISDGWIKGEILEKGTKLLWQENPTRAVAFSAATGRGEILICLLHLNARINSDSKNYDPAAERIFLNLLARPLSASPAPPR